MLYLHSLIRHHAVVLKCKTQGQRTLLRLFNELTGSHPLVQLLSHMDPCKICGFYGGVYEENRLLSSYLTVDTLRLRYRVQPVNAM
jgi:hypothetical protein